LIVKHERLNYYYELYKIDLNGSKIWNKTILDLNWRAMHTSFGFYMEFGTNGLLYIGSPINTAAGGTDLGLAILNPENAPYPPSTTSTDGFFDNPLVFILFVVGGISAVVIILVYIKKVKG
jgi:hypothetical protein